MSELKPLWEIQVLDEQKRFWEQKLREAQAPMEIKTLKKEIEEGRAVFKKLKEEYDSLKKDLKVKEMDVAAAAEKMEILSRRLYSGAMKNVKEINSTSKKIEGLKDSIEKEEDKILNMMERQDIICSRLEEMKARLNEKIGEYRRLYNSNLSAQKKIKQRLEHISNSRNELVDKLNAGLWQKYTAMKKKFNDPLARVEKGICKGCQVGIPFDDLKLLKQGKGPVFCNHCGRMLYWEK